MVKYQNALTGISKELDLKLKWHVNEFVDPSERKAEPKHSKVEAIVCYNVLILATCCDCLMIQILCFCFTATGMFINKTFRLLRSASFINCHKLYGGEQYSKVMKHPIFNHMWVVITSSWERRKWGRRASGSPPMGKYEKRNLSSCSSSLFCFSVCLTLFIHPYFSRRKHNSSQLKWSQGEHDHGNHTGDQSQRRISGKGEVAFCNIWKCSIVNVPYQTLKEDWTVHFFCKKLGSKYMFTRPLHSMETVGLTLHVSQWGFMSWECNRILWINCTNAEMYVGGGDAH